MAKVILTSCFLFVCCFNFAWAQKAETDILDISEFIMDEAKEILLASSAAPSEVSGKATILVLKENGYEKVVEGTNGILCYVVRSWGRPMYFEKDEPNYRPSYLVPECLDPNGISIILPMQRFRTSLVIKGTPAVEINRLTRETFETGRFQRIKTVSLSYMMSNETRYSSTSKGIPHIMVYLPDEYNNTTIGIESLRGTNGFFIEGGPDQPYTAAVIYRPEYGIDIKIEK